MSEDSVKVVRVTATEFELSDGRVYEHPVPFEPDEVPTPDEFQEFYDHWKRILILKDERQATNFG